MIKLFDVTAIAIASIRILGTIKALEVSCENINFGAVKLLSHIKPNNLPEFIQFEECPEIKNIDDFNYYMFKEMGKHVQTSHCLTIQDHARVLNFSAWRDSWLEYSYIGSPWPIVENSYMANDGTRSRVGNGGWSLRSSYLLNLPKIYDLPLREEQGWKNEDGQICCYYKKEFLNWGIKYAPLDIAVKFGFENIVPENIGIKPFGYHRNLPPWDYLV